jgi:hypothetical protein
MLDCLLILRGEGSMLESIWCWEIKNQFCIFYCYWDLRDNYRILGVEGSKLDCLLLLGGEGSMLESLWYWEKKNKFCIFYCYWDLRDNYRILVVE